MILAIDPGTKTGWALIKNGKVYESGTQNFSKKAGESNGMMFIKFRNWLGSILDLNVRLVVYEQTFSKSRAASELLSNLRGRIEEECDARNINYTTVYATSLKKWATGSGKADKGQMMARAVEVLGRKPIDDNEADACLLGSYGWEEYGQ